MHLYDQPQGVQTRWASFENPSAARNAGGTENAGFKGHAFDSIAPGETKTLLDVAGSGVVTRFWCTIDDRSPEMLRGLRLDMYWDSATRPAVSVPLGDFFGTALGRKTAFECALFSDPEGRSCNCFVPMPFRTHARVTVTNETPKHLVHLFYDIDMLLNVRHTADMRYFHAHFRRESPNALGREYTILPHVAGRGRCLGSNVGVIASEAYEGAWWGEGEVKVRLGRDEHATLCGTGTEDYIGTGWGQGVYSQRLQGCTISDNERRQWAFYRYHIDDPVYFDDGISVAIQTIGGAPRDKVIALQKKNVPAIPVSIDAGAKGGFIPLAGRAAPLDLSREHDGWCNFWRQDDWSSTAYFYLDSSEGVLPDILPADLRTAGLTIAENATARADG